MRLDEELQNDIDDELKRDPRLTAADIRILCKDGAVTLVGNVPNYAEKLAAESAARRANGNVEMANDVEVKLPVSSRRSDATISQAASQVLSWNVWIPENVKVSVEKGWVTLTGEVNWGFQRDEAVNALSHLVGIRGISNLIAVRQKHNRSP